MTDEQEAELRYEAGMYQALYENAKNRIEALEATLRLIEGYEEKYNPIGRIAALEAALRRIADAPAWGAPDRWETTPAEVRQFASAALAPEQDK
jgi:hypothetical protein